MMHTKESSKEIEPPIWSSDEDILEFVKYNCLRKKEKDYYTYFLIEKLLARIETLEGCVDDLVAEKI